MRIAPEMSRVVRRAWTGSAEALYPTHGNRARKSAPITTSYIKDKNSKEKWQRELDRFSLFAGRALSVDKGIDDSEIATNQHNRALAWLFKSFGYLQGDPADAVTRYTRACSVAITCGIWP